MTQPRLVAFAVAGVLFLLFVGGGFLWSQTRVIEREPNAAEAEAMITKADLMGQSDGGTPEPLVRVFPSMPMLWLNYRHGGTGLVQVRSHLLRYDDVALAQSGVERFAEGDARWLSGCATEAWPLPASVEAGELKVGEGCFLLTARRGGAYVHVSATGWRPADSEALDRAIAPSLEALEALPWPPE